MLCIVETGEGREVFTAHVSVDCEGSPGYLLDWCGNPYDYGLEDLSWYTQIRNDDLPPRGGVLGSITFGDLQSLRKNT